MTDWKQLVHERLSRIQLAPERVAEIVEELAQDLEQRYSEALAHGASPQSAQRAVLRELENSDRLARAIREAEFTPLPPRVWIRWWPCDTSSQWSLFILH